MPRLRSSSIRSSSSFILVVDGSICFYRYIFIKRNPLRKPNQGSSCYNNRHRGASAISGAYYDP